MRWVVVAALESLPFLLYASAPNPYDRIILSLYLGITILIMFIESRARETLSRSHDTYAGFAVATVVVGIFSVFMVYVSAMAQQDNTKYAGSLLVFFSLLLLVGAPSLRLAKLGDFLRMNGIDALHQRGDFRVRDEHFMLDYALGRWFQHGTFALGYLLLLAGFLYGWFLLGVLTLVYSVFLFALTFLTVKRLAERALAPYKPSDVVGRVESTYPPRSARSILAHPSGGVATLVTLLFIGALGYPNLFSIGNLPLLLALLIFYALFMSLYLKAKRHVSKRG